jgi:hypothetical protein
VDGITCGESGCSEPTVIIPVPDYSNILVLDGMAIAEHRVEQLGASEVQYAVVRPLPAGMLMNCAMSRVARLSFSLS